MEELDCFQCGKPIDLSSGHVKSKYLTFHNHCHDEFKEELKKAHDKESQAHHEEREKTNAILAQLERTLKPKIWQAIKWELSSHRCYHLSIVPLSKTKGEKKTGKEYFRQSTAIRHVFDDVSSDPYSSDCYGGYIYIRLNKNRYLQMFICG